VKIMGVLLLFLVSLIALLFSLQVRLAGEARIEPASASKPDRSAARPMGLPSARGRDGGFGVQGRVEPLRQLDPGKLDRAYRLGVPTEPRR
jgi:hypothetical protein